MQSLKSVLTSIKDWVADRYDAVKDWFSTHRINWGFIANVLTIGAFVFGVIALLALVWLYVRPINTANIKVPVATDQASYSPGEDISGIFFGDTYYTGEVRVLREVFCKDYKGVIKPPAGSADGDFFASQSRPRHLEGQTVTVGNLPANIPVGSNCVLQFTNVYRIQTPFGIRVIEYQYYTQNFSIVSIERRQQLDCEATGRKDCKFLSENNTETAAQPITPATQSSPEADPTQERPSTPQAGNTYNDNRTTTNNTTTTEPATPAPRYVEQCTANLGVIKIGCRQVLVD